MILGLIHLGTQQNMTQPPTFVGARSCYEYFQRDPIGQFANSVTVKRAHDYIPTNMSFSYKMQKTSYKMQKPVHPRLQQRMPVFSAKSPPCICDHAAVSASVSISARTPLNQTDSSGRCSTFPFSNAYCVQNPFIFCTVPNCFLVVPFLEICKSKTGHNIDLSVRDVHIDHQNVFESNFMTHVTLLAAVFVSYTVTNYTSNGNYLENVAKRIL